MKIKHFYISFSLVVLTFWQYFGSTSNSVRLYVSSPWILVKYFGENYSSLIWATTVTFSEAILGLTIATILGLSIMIVFFYNPKLINYALPFMITSQVVPVIVLAPFFILVLGIGLSSKVMMAAVMSFFPIIVNTTQGYKVIPRHVHELLFIYRTPMNFKIKRIFLPSSLPSLMAGLKVSATLSVIGAIVAEFTGAKAGLGKNLFISAIRLEPDLMMTSLLLSTLVGLSLYGIVRSIEKKLVGWYE